MIWEFGMDANHNLEGAQKFPFSVCLGPKPCQFKWSSKSGQWPEKKKGQINWIFRIGGILW